MQCNDDNITIIEYLTFCMHYKVTVNRVYVAYIVSTRKCVN